MGLYLYTVLLEFLYIPFRLFAFREKIQKVAVFKPWGRLTWSLGPFEPLSIPIYDKGPRTPPKLVTRFVAFPGGLN